MDTSTSELTELLAALHARDRTTARRSLLMTFAALLVGGAWLLYSFREVRSANSELLATQYKLQEETKALEEKERQLGEKTALLEAMRAKIGDAYSILTELDPLLLEFGWTKDNLTPDYLSHCKSEPRRKPGASQLTEAASLIQDHSFLLSQGGRCSEGDQGTVR
jgi:hypothetical protein